MPSLDPRFSGLQAEVLDKAGNPLRSGVLSLDLGNRHWKLGEEPYLFPEGETVWVAMAQRDLKDGDTVRLPNGEVAFNKVDKDSGHRRITATIEVVGPDGANSWKVHLVGNQRAWVKAVPRR